MATSSYDDRAREVGLGIPGGAESRPGLDLQLFGGLCFFMGVGVSVGSMFYDTLSVAMFGVTISPPMTSALWMAVAGILLAAGYGFTFHQSWVGDMTVTTLGFLAAGIAMNGAAWGLTLAGIASLIGVTVVAVYVLWRSTSVVTTGTTRPPDDRDRGRRE